MISLYYEAQKKVWDIRHSGRTHCPHMITFTTPAGEAHHRKGQHGTCTSPFQAIPLGTRDIQMPS